MGNGEENFDNESKAQRSRSVAVSTLVLGDGRKELLLLCFRTLRERGTTREVAEQYREFSSGTIGT